MAALSVPIPSGVLALREKLGPILWQFPPNFGWNKERFTEFFEMLPHDTGYAAKLAKNHDDKVKGRAWTKTDAVRPVRVVVAPAARSASIS